MADLRIVLLSGSFKAGKTSVALELINKRGFLKISSSDYLRTLLKNSEGLDNFSERQKLQEKGDELDLKTDYYWVVDPLASSSISENPSVSNWLFDAVRKSRQIDHFRQRFGAAVTHVHLEAPDSIIKIRSKLSDERYNLAKNHPNELSARSLGPISDYTFDTSVKSAREIAILIANGEG